MTSARRQRLLMMAAKKGAKGLDVSTYRQVIDEAVDVDGFVDYRGAYDYARGIEEAVDAVEELLKEGHAAEAIELAEHALRAVEEAVGSVDDSDGHMGGILERLQEIHRKACKKAKPDPEALARQEAQAGGCSNDLWMQLAAGREMRHPEDVLPIYRRQVERTLDRKNNQAYGEAVALLPKVRDLGAGPRGANRRDTAPRF